MLLGVCCGHDGSTTAMCGNPVFVADAMYSLTEQTLLSSSARGLLGQGLWRSGGGLAAQWPPVEGV